MAYPNAGQAARVRKANTMARDTTRNADSRPADDEAPSASELLRHSLATGDPAVADLVHRVLDRRERDRQRHAHRVALFGPEFADVLRRLDRRREAAYRMPTICSGEPHRHSLRCHDLLADTG